MSGSLKDKRNIKDLTFLVGLWPLIAPKRGQGIFQKPWIIGSKCLCVLFGTLFVAVLSGAAGHYLDARVKLGKWANQGDVKGFDVGVAGGTSGPTRSIEHPSIRPTRDLKIISNFCYLKS